MYKAITNTKRVISIYPIQLLSVSTVIKQHCYQMCTCISEVWNKYWIKQKIFTLSYKYLIWESLLQKDTAFLKRVIPCPVRCQTDQCCLFQLISRYGIFLRQDHHGLCCCPLLVVLRLHLDCRLSCKHNRNHPRDTMHPRRDKQSQWDRTVVLYQNNS